MRPTVKTIDCAALRHNLSRVRELAPQSKVIAMVKANAYGHGLIEIAKALDAADALGVASLQEAVRLREAGIQQAIVLMEGLFTEDELAEAEAKALSLVVHHEQQLAMLERYRAKKPFSVWLKINTGMHRLGIPTALVQSFYQRLKAQSVNSQVGFMTHFANADLISDLSTSNQIQTFSLATYGLDGPRSLCNSAGIINWPLAHAQWVRPGLMLYGASPIGGRTGSDYDLQPVMTLTSKIISIVPVKKGGSVGYGSTFTAEKDTLIGIVAAGYGDGYPQAACNGTPALVNGKRVALAGRVSMDMLTVDLSSQPEAALGDEVILWGKGLPVEEVASHCHSSAYELLTRMTARPRISVINHDGVLTASRKEYA